MTVAIRAIRQIEHPPDPSGTVKALKELGYSFEQAIADLVDNAIDADAQTVLIRFNRDHSNLLSLAVCDDGVGMTEDVLNDAMTLGRRSHAATVRLGKFGMGLKTASFSQADSLTVLTNTTRKNACGQRWTTEDMEAGWYCDILDPGSVETAFESFEGPVSFEGSGTMVVLERLNESKVAPGYVDGKVDALINSLRKHLGLHFHRFIERGRVQILIDTYRVDTLSTGLPHKTTPLDPFSYKASGMKGYPKKYKLNGRLSPVGLEAHIWPPNSGRPGYRLGGGAVAERQGFYFYRNSRLIQAGGWNGLRSDTEPHLSLARVRVDLPPKLDEMFQLSLQKTSIDVPDAFIAGIGAVGAADGTTFKEYLAAAQRKYRAKAGDRGRIPVVPGKGFPAELARRFRTLLAPRNRAASEVGIEWRRLRGKQFFKIDPDRDLILVNQRFRKTIIGDTAASKADAPLVKTLLFLLLESDIDRERRSKAHDKKMKQYQQMLYQAATLEQRRQQR